MVDDAEETLPESKDAKPKIKKNKQLSEKKLKRLQEAHERRGVIYISRIPPNLVSQIFNPSTTPPLLSLSRLLCLHYYFTCTCIHIP